MKTLKILAITLMIFIIQPIYADIIHVTPPQSMQQEVDTWQFTNPKDGMFFLLGEYSNMTLDIHVNDTINGVAADPVTVECNASTGYQTHRVMPGSSITCIGDFNDMSSMHIAPMDFKNGAEGTYEYKPIQ